MQMLACSFFLFSNFYQSRYWVKIESMFWRNVMTFVKKVRNCIHSIISFKCPLKNRTTTMWSFLRESKGQHWQSSWNQYQEKSSIVWTYVWLSSTNFSYPQYLCDTLRKNLNLFVLHHFTISSISCKCLFLGWSWLTVLNLPSTLVKSCSLLK